MYYYMMIKNIFNFNLKEDTFLESESEYINYMNNLVANRFTLSNLIIKNNIYDYILK